MTKEKHRVVIMGSAFVGKTQIVSQFLYDKFTNRYRQTIEELHRGEYELPDQSSLTLDILDTSGAFAFPAMRDLSISTSNAFLLVFAINSEESWTEVIKLRDMVRKSIVIEMMKIVMNDSETDNRETRTQSADGCRVQQDGLIARSATSVQRSRRVNCQDRLGVRLCGVLGER